MIPYLNKRRLWQGGRILLLALLLAGLILSGRFAHFWDTSGFAFVFGGGIALFLIGFSLRQVGSAARYAAGRPLREEEASLQPYLWEALGRNFWVVGVLGTIASFVLTLGGPSEGIQSVAFSLTASFRPALYGMFLAVVCAIPALKSRDALIRAKEERPTAVGGNGRRPWTFGNAVAYALLVALLGWTIVLPASRGFLQEQLLLSFFFDLSALLVVGGGAVIMILFLGRTSLGTALTSGLAVTGLLGSLIGLMQTLFAFIERNIRDVSSALAFVISSCFLALLGMILAGLPLADHDARIPGRPGGLVFHRLASFVFPLLALLFLVLTFIGVVTPVKM